MSLPDRSHQAEDDFVGQLAHDDDLDAIVEAIELAMGDRRPRLAARLVGLLDGRVEIPPESDLARAVAAARLLLMTDRPSPDAVFDMEDAWSRVRRRRMTRILGRMRAARSGNNVRFGRLGKRRR